MLTVSLNEIENDNMKLYLNSAFASLLCESGCFY